MKTVFEKANYVRTSVRTTNIYSWFSLFPKELRHLAYNALCHTHDPSPLIETEGIIGAISVGFSWALTGNYLFWNELTHVLSTKDNDRFLAFCATIKDYKKGNA